MDTKDRKAIKDAFGEDINIVRKGTSNKGSQFDKSHCLSPIDKSLPFKADTGERIMQVAIGKYQKIYENPLQMAISLSHFEEWCEKTGWTPTYASIAYFLNISKSSLVKYTNDKTEYMCYSLIDTITGEYIYSTNDYNKLQLYIDRYNIVDDIKNIHSNNSKDNIGSSINIKESNNNISKNKKDNISKGKCQSIQQKIDSGEFRVIMTTTTFADILEPLNNWLEMINEEQAIHSRNPAWNIFKAINRMGRTTQYSNKQDISIAPANPIDDMSDEEIIRAAQERPDGE